MNIFSVVGTPIGNLEDITLRALDALKKADVILCEDTRMTKRLLDRHNIQAKTVSYHAHSKIGKVSEIIQMLREGKNLALVSDAGTPGISDPGSMLLKTIRAELSKEIESGQLKIEAVPGPSALTSALSIAGVPCADFIFLGFLPHKKGRETLFKEIAETERTVIFYESPHRIMKAIDSLMRIEGKQITVARELTKIYEEIISGDASYIKSFFESHPDKMRGEFVVIVSQK